MAPEFLSVTPQRVRCYVCGTYSENADHWMYRLRLTGHSAVCPSCTAKVEQEIGEQTTDPNLFGAVFLGAMAAMVGSAAWYGLAVATDRIFAYVALGIGWLVGKAVVLGSGNKRGGVLQFVAGGLAALGVLGGTYLTTNHILRSLGMEDFSGWLSPAQFVSVYGGLLARGEGLGNLILTVTAVPVAIILPRADRLASELPKGRYRWL